MNSPPRILRVILPTIIVGLFVVDFAQAQQTRYKGLTKDDVILLSTTSTRYYLNGKILDPVETDYAVKETVRILKQRQSSSRQVKLAKASLVMYTFILKYASTVNQKKDIEKLFPAGMLDAQIKGVFQSLINEKIITFAEFSKGPAKLLEEMIDAGRRNEIGKNINEIAMLRSMAILADVIDENYLTHSKKLDSLQFRCSAHNQDPYRRFDERGVLKLIRGQFIGIRYQGKETINNLVVTAEIKTKGVVNNIKPAQQGILALNQQFGAGDKNVDVRKLLITNNILNTMPKKMAYYIPELKPGDELHLAIGDTDLPHISAVNVRLTAQQGTTYLGAYPPPQKAK